ncbi:hypothetical protein IV203_005571 [Nitzschia inconspicua]|uniref:MOSC domain-containing protein n=1 Tax=Nitzschia inconspicua TaxID=303405 RepID=A0A9K3KP33_9STRA|nr:hypothetical protein IV203_005571 [Nitzschia inconspicua]
MRHIYTSSWSLLPVTTTAFFIYTVFWGVGNSAPSLETCLWRSLLLVSPSVPVISTIPSTFPLFVHALSSVGEVVRLAARQYHPQNSRPSSREYSTRKDECATLEIQTSGCVGDYNHYRTLALQSTPDRAVSLLTCDVIESLQATSYPTLERGDLGENVLIEGLSFRFFQVGKQYCIDSSSCDEDEVEAGAIQREGADGSAPSSINHTVILEITERIQPCANLCKLPYINDESLTPKERIERCHEFIVHLDQWDGYRGWYAKVIQQGIIRNGATVSKLGGGK